MKILHLVGTLNPGGIERVVTDLAVAQKLHQNQLAVCCLLERTGPFISLLERENIPVYEACYQDKPWQLPKRLSEILDLFQPDVIHSHVNFSLLWQVLSIPRRTKIRFIITQHTLLTPTFWVNIRSRLIYRLIKPYIYCHTAVSETAAAHAAQLYGLNKQQFVIVRNGIVPERYGFDKLARQRIRQAMAVDDDMVLWGSVGRLAHVKGYDVLLRAFARARVSSPHLHLAIAGDGPQLSSLQALARQLDCAAYIHWLGPRSDIPAVLSTFDRYVQPSRKESASLTLLEAMANGLPIVASCVGGMKELANYNDAIFLVEAEDVASLSAAILRYTYLNGRRSHNKLSQELTLATMHDKFYQVYTAYI